MCVFPNLLYELLHNRVNLELSVWLLMGSLENQRLGFSPPTLTQPNWTILKEIFLLIVFHPGLMKILIFPTVKIG